MPLGRPRSAPGYFMTVFASLVIIRQSIAIADPGPVMEEFNVPDEDSVRVMAFLLILINIHDLLSALLDNWTLYTFSFFSRLAATAFFWNLGGGWANLAQLELGSTALLGGCMWWGSRK